MANKINNIPEEALEALKSIEEKYGIEPIKEYMKLYKKRMRKIAKKPNRKEVIANEVYRLIAVEGYGRIKAEEAVAEKYDITPNTVRNHCANFDKMAQKMHYCSFGYIMELCNELNRYYINDYIIGDFLKLNDIDENTGYALYYKYLYDRENPRKKEQCKEEKHKYIKDFKIPDYPELRKDLNLEEEANKEQNVSQEGEKQDSNTFDDDVDIPF